MDEFLLASRFLSFHWAEIVKTKNKKQMLRNKHSWNTTQKQQRFFSPQNLSGKNTQKTRAFWFEIVRIF